MPRALRGVAYGEARNVGGSVEGSLSQGVLVQRNRVSGESNIEALRVWGFRA